MSSALKMSNLPKAEQAYLKQNGFGSVPVCPLQADASSRQYWRLEGVNMLLMTDRQNPDGFEAFVRLSSHLNGLGLSAPRINAADHQSYMALIEDFGDQTYANCLNKGIDEHELYSLAVDALAHLHNAKQAANVSAPSFDLERMLNEVTLFAEWFATAVNPRIDQETFNKDVHALWFDAFRKLDLQPETLVLRDFHVDNLMLLDERDGIARCGLLDFQDALLGAREYDLLSLLQDARRDLAPGLEQKMLERYLGQVETQRSRDEILHRYHVFGVLRHARIAGIFTRLDKRDGKSWYLTFLPRVLRQLENAIEHAGLRELTEFLDKSLPGWQEYKP